MKFNSHTTVEGKFVSGAIKNYEFSLTQLTNRNRTLPPLPTTYLFNSKELGELIRELQSIKNKIDSEQNVQAR
jgi:hypothetical protein